MVIKFTSSEEFRRLLDALGSELWDADFHLKTYKGLVAKVQEFRREFNQTPAFWTFTFRAHLNAALFGLMRIYDGHSSSLSLRNLLDTIKENLPMFDAAAFRKRLQSNPYVDSLASNATKPDEKILDDDIGLVSEKDPLVKKLTVWRNNLYAHKSAKNIVSGLKISSQHPITVQETELLVTRAYDVLNCYKNLFDASWQSGILLGAEEFEYVLTSIRERLSQDGRGRRKRVQ